MVNILQDRRKQNFQPQQQGQDNPDVVLISLEDEEELGKDQEDKENHRSGQENQNKENHFNSQEDSEDEILVLYEKLGPSSPFFPIEDDKKDKDKEKSKDKEGKSTEEKAQDILKNMPVLEIQDDESPTNNETSIREEEMSPENNFSSVQEQQASSSAETDKIMEDSSEQGPSTSWKFLTDEELFPPPSSVDIPALYASLDNIINTSQKAVEKTREVLRQIEEEKAERRRQRKELEKTKLTQNTSLSPSPIHSPTDLDHLFDDLQMDLVPQNPSTNTGNSIEKVTNVENSTGKATNVSVDANVSFERQNTTPEERVPTFEENMRNAWRSLQAIKVPVSTSAANVSTSTANVSTSTAPNPTSSSAAPNLNVQQEEVIIGVPEDEASSTDFLLRHVKNEIARKEVQATNANSNAIPIVTNSPNLNNSNVSSSNSNNPNPQFTVPPPHQGFSTCFACKQFKFIYGQNMCPECFTYFNNQQNLAQQQQGSSSSTFPPQFNNTNYYQQYPHHQNSNLFIPSRQMLNDLRRAPKQQGVCRMCRNLQMIDWQQLCQNCHNIMISKIQQIQQNQQNPNAYQNAPFMQPPPNHSNQINFSYQQHQIPDIQPIASFTPHQNFQQMPHANLTEPAAKKSRPMEHPRHCSECKVLLTNDNRYKTTTRSMCMGCSQKSRINECPGCHLTKVLRPSGFCMACMRLKYAKKKEADIAQQMQEANVVNQNQSAIQTQDIYINSPAMTNTSTTNTAATTPIPLPLNQNTEYVDLLSSGSEDES